MSNSTKKRVYVAGPFVDRQKAKDVAKTLTAMGYLVTHNWYDYEGENENQESKEFLLNCAYNDYSGVARADIVLVINTAKSEGKAVEQGIAIALHKPIIVWTPGERPSSNIFHLLPNYTHVTTFEQVLEAISE